MTTHPLLAPGPARVLGILNVTPDSFSDGGRFDDTERAVAQGRALAAAGADIVDVGGESTRPGAPRVAPADELARVLPVIRALAGDGIAVSIDTMRAETAAAAVAAGARVVNDVSGGLADPEMLATVAALGVPYICMHWRGHSADMERQATYSDVVGEVAVELRARLAAAAAAGLDPELVVLDPGLGFAKNAEHNWRLLADLDELAALGRPLLIGASRKRFLSTVLAEGADLAARDSAYQIARDSATAALTALLAERGVWGVRTHTVAEQRAAIEIAHRLRSTKPRPTRTDAPAYPLGDRIELRGITAHGFHGVHAEERRLGQRFVADVTCWLDLAPAAQSDDLAATIDYADLAAAVKADIEGPPLDLIEALGSRIAATCLADSRVFRVSVTIHKPDVDLGVSLADVAVTVQRSVDR